MLFTESQLQMGIDPFDILDEAVYLTEAEMAMQPQMVSIVENSRLQAYVVDFNGIYQLAESADIDYFDAVILVLEQEGIDPSKACIAIDEADLIQFPELSDIGLPVVVTPISKQSLVYQVCETLAEEYLETEDDAILQELANSLSLFDKIGERGERLAKKLHYHLRTNADDRKDIADNEAKANAHYAAEDRLMNMRSTDPGYAEQKKKYQDTIDDLMSFWNADSDRANRLTQHAIAQEKWGGIGYKIGKYGSMMSAGLGALYKINEYRNKPKSVIAKKIASLRSIYQKWMAKAQASKDSGIAAKLKRGAAKILQVIDKLMAFLQRKADHR